MFNEIRLLNLMTTILYGLLLLILLGAGLYWFAHRPYFSLNLIRVEGELRHVSLPALRAATLPTIKGNFFTVDLDAVRESFETVSWVRKASVRREWPNRLVINLTEHEALATWSDGKNENQLLSKLGEIFSANEAEAEEDGVLPDLGGPQGSEKDVLLQYQLLKEMLSAIQMKPVAVTLSPRYAWSLRTENGLQVEIGRELDGGQAQNAASLISGTLVKDRVSRLIRAYPQVKAMFPGRLQYVDLRYPNGFALRASGVSISSDDKARKK